LGSVIFSKNGGLKSFLHTSVSEVLHMLPPSCKPFHSFVMGILYSSHIDLYQSLRYVGGFPYIP